jgi:hypothetical protein
MFHLPAHHAWRLLLELPSARLDHSPILEQCCSRARLRVPAVLHIVGIVQYTHTLVRAHRKTNNQIKANAVEPSQVLNVTAVDASVGTNRLQ